MLSEYAFFISTVLEIAINSNISANSSEHGDNIEIVHLKFFSYTYHQFLKSLQSLWLRIALITSSLSMFCIVLFVRLLAELICSVYDYFGANVHLRAKLLLSFCCVLIFVIVGLFRQLVFFCSIGICIAMIYQFVFACIAIRKLRILLYKRLFDAINFENASLFVINYFKINYRNYRYASFILLVSLFLQILAVSVIYLHSIIMTIACLPHTWLNAILYGPKSLVLYSPHGYIRDYDYFISAIIGLIITLATTIQSFPYLMVTLKLAFVNIKNMNNHKIKIKNQVERHNSSYAHKNYQDLFLN